MKVFVVEVLCGSVFCGGVFCAGVFVKCCGGSSCRGSGGVVVFFVEGFVMVGNVVVFLWKCFL